MLNSAHLKLPKNREPLLIETILCQTATEGATTMINDIDKKELLSLLIWMTLGDGNITVPASGKNGFFQCSHTDKHEDYMQIKKFILSCVTGAKYKKYYHSRQDNYNYHIWTKCHPMFTKLRSYLYNGKRKVLSEHSIKVLTPFSLAIFYQDDGRYNVGKSYVSISKPLFSQIELLALAKSLVDKFGLIFRVPRMCHLKDGTIGYGLSLRTKDKDKFFKLIEPYVVPSMYYKIGRGSKS